MSEHTPGPWTAEHHKFNDGKEVYYINGPNGALGYPVLVAQVQNDEADARLIAAAPDLLAALDKAAYELHQGMVLQDSKRGERRLQNLEAQIRAAIASAKEETK